MLFSTGRGNRVDVGDASKRKRRRVVAQRNLLQGIPHLNGRDITLVRESIAPLQEPRDYKRQIV